MCLLPGQLDAQFDLRVRNDTAEAQKAILSDGNVSSLIDTGLFDIEQTVIDGRTGEVAPDAAGTTRFRPGDTLLVRVDHIAEPDSVKYSGVDLDTQVLRCDP